MSHDVESAPNSSRAHNNLAVILFNQYPEEKNEEVKQNLLDKAMIEFKKANELCPDNVYSYNGMGQIYLDKKDYKNAIYYFEKHLKIYPEMGKLIYKFLATCYEKTNQFEKEIAADDSVLIYDPNNSYYMTYKGIALQHIGKDSLAIEALEKSISINPKEIAPYKNLGVLYGMEKNYQKSIEYLKKAIEVDSTDAQP